MKALQPMRECPLSSLHTAHPARSRFVLSEESSPFPVVRARTLTATVGVPTAGIVGNVAAGVALVDLRPNEKAREMTVVDCVEREEREVYLSAMTVSANQASKV